MDTNNTNFAPFLDHQSAIVGAIANTLRQRPDLIDDCVGDFSVHATEKSIPAYDPNGAASMRTWLCQCAANFAKNMLKRHCNSRRHEQVNAAGASADEGSPATGHELHSNTPTPLAALLRKEQVILAKRNMRSLSGTERALVELVLDDTPIGKAGAKLGLTPVQATRVLKRAKAKLAERCERGR